MPTKLYQRSAVALAIAACFPAAGYAAVARVDFAVGNVIAVGPDGRSRPLAKGSQIDVGDTVNTQQGRAQLRFEDGAYMSLQPETAFKVEEFRFVEKGAGNDNIVMNLLKGGMRTITGLIGRANKRNYRFRTEVATIGIRGTEYSVRYTNSIEVFCAGGSIAVENEGGTLVLGPGQGGFVPSPKQEPRRTEERPFLPPTAASNTEDPQEQITDPVNALQENFGPTTPILLTGTLTGNWAAVHHPDLRLGQPRINSFINEVVTLDANGTLQSFTDTIDLPFTSTVGTASAISSGNDGLIAWGRWENGITGGDGLFSAGNVTQDPLHYVVGLPVTNMPTSGIATYSMMGATTPSFNGIVTDASLLDSKITVNFGTSSAFYDFKMNVASQGGSATLSTPTGGLQIVLSGSQLFTGQFTSLLSDSTSISTASLQVQGFLSGPGAVRAGMAYDVSVTSLSGGSGTVSGAVAHQMTSNTAAPAPLPALFLARDLVVP